MWRHIFITYILPSHIAALTVGYVVISACLSVCLQSHTERFEWILIFPGVDLCITRDEQ